MSRALGYNCPTASGVQNFSAFELHFSPTDPLSGFADKVYSFGSADGSIGTDDVTFDSEVIGLYLLPANSPDFEGLIFMLEDGST